MTKNLKTFDKNYKNILKNMYKFRKKNKKNMND